MFLIPYGKVQIKTTLSREEIETRLEQQFTPLPKNLTFPVRGYWYLTGNIDNGRFTLDRGTGRGNFYEPIVTGAIRQQGGLRVIDLTLRLSSFTIAVELVFLPFVIVFAIFLLHLAWSEYTQYLNSQIFFHLRSALVVLGMAIAWLSGGYLLMITSFNSKARLKLMVLNEVLREKPFDLSHLEYKTYSFRKSD